AGGVVASTASSIRGLYTTLAERQQYAATVGANPASAVLGGPGFGLPNLGGIIVAEMGSVLLALVAVTGILLVVRYTRTEEETGRARLLGSPALRRPPPPARPPRPRGRRPAGAPGWGAARRRRRRAGDRHRDERPPDRLRAAGGRVGCVRPRGHGCRLGLCWRGGGCCPGGRARANRRRRCSRRRR